MFENYERAKKRKMPAWAPPLIIAVLVLHAGIVLVMWIKSIWEVEKLELPKGRISLSGQFAPPPPPPPLKGGKKPEDVKKDIIKKKKVTETVQPTVEPDKVVDSSATTMDEVGPGTDPDGDVNGSLDGVQGGVATAAPPPPPPPAPPQNVAPTAIDALMTSGNKQIIPDDVTKIEIQRSGKPKIVGSFKICLGTGGSIDSINMLKSTGFPAYDEKLKREMRDWRFRPFLINGRAAPVCTAKTFIYSQK
jgi:protein TonB